MTAPSDGLELAAGFEPADVDRWRELAAAVLRKSGVDTDDVERQLSTETYDGIQLRPLYTAADAIVPTGEPGAAPFTRGAPAGDVTASEAGGWDVRQRHDAVSSNDAVLADLENGVTSLWLASTEALGELLDGVARDAVPIVLDATADPEPLLALGAVRGNLGRDPVGLAAASGEAPDATARDAAAWAVRCAEAGTGLRAITVDATVYHDAGASDADELAAATATGVHYLRALTEAGLDVHAAADQIEFRYAATADQFGTIAKLRAGRRIWARVTEVCGVPAGQRQHAVTSRAMTTRRDPYVNMLRATVACFAAGVGGAQAVTVTPFDDAIGRPDTLARRIARNTQSILLAESSLGRVLDPAGGSWYVENRTEELARVAWAQFQDIERAGGIVAAGDLVRERIAATAARRRDAIAHRRDPITGVTDYPDLDERPLNRPPHPGARADRATPTGARADRAIDAGEDPAARANRPAPDGGRSYRGIPAGQHPDNLDTSGRGLAAIRYAADFERLRDRADAADKRPTVFLATPGPVSRTSARASFATTLFASGGIATVTSGDTTDIAAITDAFVRAGTTVACLAADDATYAELGVELTTALETAGATTVHVTGSDGTLHKGVNAVEILERTLQTLEER